MLPATTELTPLVLLMVKNAAGTTLVVTVLDKLLLVGVSVIRIDTVALPTLVTVPTKVVVSKAVIEKRTDPPRDKDTVLLILPVPLAAEQAVVTSVGVPASRGAQVQDTVPNAVLENRSATVTLAATPGPALLIVRV